MKTENQKPLLVRFPPFLRREIDIHSMNLGMTKAEFIRQSCREKIDRLQPQQGEQKCTKN